MIHETYVTFILKEDNLFLKYTLSLFKLKIDYFFFNFYNSQQRSTTHVLYQNYFEFYKLSKLVTTLIVRSMLLLTWL